MPGNNGRVQIGSLRRKDAGIKRCFCADTHYHDDHVGGAPATCGEDSGGNVIDTGEKSGTRKRGKPSFRCVPGTAVEREVQAHVAKPGEVCAFMVAGGW